MAPCSGTCSTLLAQVVTGVDPWIKREEEVA